MYAPYPWGGATKNMVNHESFLKSANEQCLTAIGRTRHCDSL